MSDLTAAVTAPSITPELDRARYLRVATFFARLFVSFILWDLVLSHVPGFRTRARQSALARWQAHARRFRRLAVRLGGVLIKLGQFLSIRVDVLPPEVTEELRGLQDAVPAESIEAVRAVMAAEFGKPVDEVFAWFSAEPEAAASLSQVHAARLRDGEEVVVKVQRPNIQRLVETDLAAIRLATNWLKLYRAVTQHVDLNRLYEEFSSTTRRELDFVAEGRNAERFATDFAGDPGIYIADVYWDYTTRRVLTLENVASIKIDDGQAIEAAGISRAAVARRLYDAYLEQIFVHNFVHADPHPGNLFVHPLDRDPDHPDAPRPFLLVFVDFGMVATIPERMRTALRDYVIAVGTRDTHRMVQSYQDAGVLLPGADKARLEELHEKLLSRLGGLKMGQLSGVAMRQAAELKWEYRDLIFEMPVQVPTDMLFAVRAVAILAGIATYLDPDFDPWSATLPFAERIAAGQVTKEWRGILAEVVELARLAVRFPARLDRFIAQAQRGEFSVQTSLAPDAQKAIRRLERSVDRLTWGLVSVGFLISGVVLRTAEGPGRLSTALIVVSALAFIWGMMHR